MVKTKNKLISREEVAPVVGEIITRLMPHCEKCEVVGSYRREKKQIHDVEFVCIPKTSLQKVDMFKFAPVRTVGFVNYITTMKKIKGCPANGKYTQREHSSGIRIDFFIADNKNYGWIKLLRTGPWQYSKYVASKQLPHWGYYSDDGYIKRRCDHTIMPVPEEKDVYKLINQEPILPFARM